MSLRFQKEAAWNSTIIVMFFFYICFVFFFYILLFSLILYVPLIHLPFPVSHLLQNSLLPWGCLARQVCQTQTAPHHLFWRPLHQRDPQWPRDAGLLHPKLENWWGKIRQCPAGVLKPLLQASGHQDHLPQHKEMHYEIGHIDQSLGGGNTWGTYGS